MISRHSHRYSRDMTMSDNGSPRAESLQSADRCSGLLRVAGSSAEGLRRELVVLRDKLASGGEVPYSAPLGLGPYRLAWAAQGSADSITVPDGTQYIRARDSNATRVAFLFAGLGEEYPGMAAGLYQAHSRFRHIIDTADEILAPTLGSGIVRRFVAEMPRRAPESPRRILPRRSKAPDRNEDVPISVAHPIVFAIECALAEMWMQLGCRPHAVLGYSLGEFAAAHVAGVFDFESGLKLITDRARLIEERAPRGALLAVPLGAEALAQYLSSEIYLVGYNGPALMVVGGGTPAIEDLAKRLDAAGHVSRRVRSPFAFHTPGVAPAREPLRALVEKAVLRSPRMLWISTVTGRAFAPEEMPDSEYWCRHLCEPVMFVRGMQTLIDAGARIFIEIGPGQSLSSSAALHPSARSQDVTLIASLPPQNDLRTDLERLLSSIGQAWCAGVDIGQTPVFRTAQAFRAPSVATNAELASALTALMAELFGRERIDPQQNIFDLGADSLFAMRLSRHMAERLRLTVSLKEIYEHPTAATLAAHLSAATGAPPQPTRLPRRIKLPNGLEIWHSLSAELQQFYHDIFEDQVYVRHGITLPPDACVLDIGANIGLFSIFAAKRCPDARIFSVEPAPPLFDILRMNLRLHCPNAVAIPCGVSDRPGSAQFTFYPESSGLSSFAADAEEEREVLKAVVRNQLALGDRRVAGLLDDEEQFLAARLRQQTYVCELRTLSDLIASFGLEKIDLLKIDVQKLEHAVLLGIEASDWPKIMQMAIEVHDLDGRLAEIVRLLRAHGFHVTVQQDRLYEGTPNHNVIATRAAIHTADREAGAIAGNEECIR